jgi:hypothetical protein
MIDDGREEHNHQDLPPPVSSPRPMSNDDWEEELAGMKDGISGGPGLPERPIRRATPPPGGFVAPPLEKLIKKEPESSRPHDLKPSPVRTSPEEKEPGDSGIPESKPVLPSSVGSKKPASVRLAEVKKALRKTVRETKAAEVKAKSLKKSGKKWITIPLSLILFVIIAISVVAGYYFRTRRGVEYYIEKLKSEDQAVQSHARDSLSNLGEVAVPNLEELIESGSEPEVLAAVDTLALIDSKGSVELLMKLTACSEANVRKRALAALGERGAPQAFSNVEKQISSTDHETRICAIAALENFDPEKSVPILLKLLDDSDWQIRNEAAKTLVEITGQSLGIPKSTSTEGMDKIIRERWHKWWEENSATFQRP